MEMIEPMLRQTDALRSDGYVAFCRKRMDIVRSNPDRVAALASVLRPDAPVEDEKIMGWAIHQLIALHSDRADDALDRYVIDLGHRYPPMGSPMTPQASMHRMLAEEVRAAIPYDSRPR
jgi:hypothetical protein